jgi:predicted AlkP superfamily phosphohydrolase/phosphomutase
VFLETDVVQHKTWNYMDRSHPQHDPVGARKYSTAILDIYRRIDEHLPLLLDQADDDTSIIIMSDHGAGPIDKWLNLNSWLLQEGLLRLKPNFLSRLRHLLFRLGWTPSTAFKLGSGLRLGMVDRAADRTKRKASIMRAHPLMRSFLSFADVDWRRTRAYTLGGNMTGFWVNLKGREPEGHVSPGADYEEVREELMDRLIGLRDPIPGNPSSLPHTAARSFTGALTWIARPMYSSRPWTSSTPAPAYRSSYQTP